MAKLKGLRTLLTVYAIRLAMANPVRRQAEAEIPTVVNDITFWKDRECSEINGHMRWDGQNGRRASPPPQVRGLVVNVVLQSGRWSRLAQQQYRLQQRTAAVRYSCVRLDTIARRKAMRMGQSREEPAMWERSQLV
jgi:hypothetical protein